MSNLTPSASKAILPFSILSENRTEPFTSDMEIATIYALAELKREKGGGLLSRREGEKIAFITKIGYPLWLIPLLKRPLLFDGLNRFNHKEPYAKIPNVKLFMENLKRTANSYETHLAFLSDHLNFFEIPIEEKEILIKGLISDSDFLAEFDSFYSEAKEIEEEPKEIALIPQIIENADISSQLEELKTIYNSLEENQNRLYRCMKLIKKINGQHLEYLRSIVGETKYKFKEMINKEQEIVKPQVIKLKKDYDNQIVKTTKSFQRQELPLYKEKIKLEKSMKIDQTKMENCKFEALRCAEKNDKTGEQQWKERSKRTKKIISENSKKLREIEKNLEILKERETLSVFKLKTELDTKIRDLQKKLHDLEASCEAKVIGYEQDIEKLKKNSKIIIDQLGKFAKIEEIDITEFDNLGIKDNPEIKKATLFYVTFYLICYQLGSKRRYSIIAPSIVNTICLTTKLKSAFSRSRIKQILSNRFHSIMSLVDELHILIQQNQMFHAEIKELGEEFNTLKNSSTDTHIKKGLKYLKTEGWLSEKEYENLIPK